MNELIEYFKFINQQHWGDSIYQWLLYFAILLILFSEKKRMAKIIFGIFPLLFLLGIFNPVFYRAIHLVFKSADPYYARMFSFMPLFFVIAAGFMQILKRAHGYTKMVLTSIVVAVIVLTGKNFYNSDWMNMAQNIQKVPKEAIELNNVLPVEENICVAFPQPLNIYMRQINSSILMPYGRNITRLGNELSQSELNIDAILELCGQQAVDYFVVERNDERYSAFALRGFLPCVVTDMYYVYKTEGVPRINRVFNQKRQLISATLIDSQGIRDNNKRGYSTISYAYDSFGNMIRDSYFDKTGEPVLMYPGGYQSRRRTWYISKKAKADSYYDANDKQVMVNGRYVDKYDYDISGRLIRQTFYDLTGNKMTRLNDFYASIDTSYNSYGNIECQLYLDERGRSTLSKGGYARMRREYNDNQQWVGVTYYDADDRLIGAIGEAYELPQRCMSFFEKTEWVELDQSGDVSFETYTSGNCFSFVRFQVYDMTTGECLAVFGGADKESRMEGTYRHDGIGGLYMITLKANGSLEDEVVRSIEYLQEGETLYFHYNVEQFQDRQVRLSDFYIGRQ